MSTISGKPPRPLTVNVDGKKGNDADDGVSGSSGWSSGAHGSHGTDATPAKPGARGGDIDLGLSVQPAGDGFELKADVVTTETLGGKPMGSFLPAGSDIYLSARGGAGGRGGVGGNGGDGARGADGDDATQYSDAEDGGRGGDGGNSGRGTSGAEGGTGGRVRVRVAERDTDALAAVKGADVSGGKGGPVGRHGTPGSGGSGGSGGDSHSWTETGADGKSETKSRSSGSSGWSGNSGSAPTETLTDGKTGPAGAFGIDVVDANGQSRTYSDRYRLETTKVTVRDSNDDGVFEPGERGTVDVGLRNTSDMASPSAPLKAHPSGDWLTAASGQPVAPSLSSGMTTDVKGLGFQVRSDDQRHVGEGLNAQTSVRTAVVAERVGHTLDESVKATPLTVRYPVRISMMQGDRTATRERPAKVSWELTNVSTKPLGSESESQRLIQSMLQVTGGDIAAEHLVFIGPDGKRGPVTQALSSAIAKLGPGETVKLEGQLAFSISAPFHSQVTLSAMLDVGALDAPATAKAIQAREFSVQLARTYAKDPDAGLLLVTNNRTTKAEVAAWEQLATELGTKVNVWNLSLYGGASLTRAMADVDLGRDFAKKTVVMLNNDFDPEKGVGSPVGHLGERDFLLASVKNRTSAYVVGGAVDVKAQLFAKTGDEAKRFDGVDALNDGLEAKSLGTDAPLGADAIAIEARGAPSKEKLEAAAAEVVERLRDEHPERRFAVELDYQPKKDDSWFAFAKKQQLGTVTVRRGADVDQNVLVHQQADDVHAPAFILSPQNRYALAKSLSLPLKLSTLDRLTQQPDDPNVGPVLKALLADLAEEQQALRTKDFNGELSRAELSEKLRDLREVAQHFTEVNPTSPRGKLVLDLAAELANMTEQAKTMGDKLLPSRRRVTLDELSDELVQTLLRTAFGTTTAPSVRQGFEQRLEALEKRDAGRDEAARLGMTPYLRPEGLWSSKVTTDFDAGR